MKAQFEKIKPRSSLQAGIRAVTQQTSGESRIMTNIITMKEGFADRKIPAVRRRTVKDVIPPAPVKLTRREYKPVPKSGSFADLPFVYRPKRRGKASNKGSNWHVPENMDYAEACNYGYDCAAHYIQFLNDNPEFVGMSILGNIVEDMNFLDESGSKGCHVGFFSYLERIIYAQGRRMNVFADVDQLRASYEEAIVQQNSGTESEGN